MPTPRLSKEQRALKRAREDRAHDKYVQKKYGLEPGQYQAMLEAQDGRCAICMRRAVNRRLAVDHDHYTNRVRGLLCYRCNQFLGQWEFEPIMVENLIIYLRALLEQGLPEVLPMDTERPKVVPVHPEGSVLNNDEGTTVLRVRERTPARPQGGLPPLSVTRKEIP